MTQDDKPTDAGSAQVAEEAAQSRPASELPKDIVQRLREAGTALCDEAAATIEYLRGSRHPLREDIRRQVEEARDEGP